MTELSAVMVLPDDERSKEEEEDDEEETTEELEIIEHETGDNSDRQDSRWQGSGIWEREENRRWQVVTDPIIPGRSRPASDSYLVTGLGVSHYLSCFEAEVAAVSSANTRIITSGSTIIRITENLEQSDDEEEAEEEDGSTGAADAEGVADDGGYDDSGEPVAGPSGCQHRHRRRSTSRPTEGGNQVPEASTDSLATNEQQQQKEEEEYRYRRPGQRQRKRWRRQRRCDKRYYYWQRTETAAAGGPGRSRARAVYVRSAESSPGRDSPSPASLARIVLYWDRLREEEEQQHSRTAARQTRASSSQHSGEPFTAVDNCISSSASSVPEVLPSAADCLVPEVRISDSIYRETEERTASSERPVTDNNLLSSSV